MAVSFIHFLKSKIQLMARLMAGGCIMTFFVCESCSRSLSWYIIVSAFTVLMWISLWLGNEYISCWLDEKITWTKEPTKRFVTGILGMLLYTIVSVWVLMTLFEKSFQVNFGGAMEMLYGAVLVTIVITMFMTGRAFLTNWKQAAIDSERLQKESITAQYNSLKNQVNPHFLFNSLNALTNLVYKDQDTAALFIKQLSEVYRYVLDTHNAEVVSLEEELKFLDSYLFLQRIRFGNSLRVVFNLEGVQTKVAPLVLQMLVENAIKHNTVAEEQPLCIQLFIEGEYLIVENGLQKKKTLLEESRGLGLVNICRRYDFLSQKKVEVIETSNKFVVKLPVIK